MTLEEILKAKGLSDEDVKSTIGEMKQNKIFTTNEENLDIRYNKLKGEFDNLTIKDGESTKLIEQLKAGTKDSEKLQGQITNYESQVAQLQEQLKQTQLESEIKVALLAAKASDVEYMTFKLKEKGELELGEDGHIKGIDDKIAGLKVQFPTQFGTETGNSKGQVIDENRLPHSEKRDSLTKEELLKKPYAERQQFFNENPEAYKEIMKS